MKILTAQYIKTAKKAYQYGYWSAPDGTMHPVDKYGHSSGARRLGLNGYDGAYSKGYLRIHTDIGDKGGESRYSRHGAECGCEGNFISKAQVMALSKLYRDHECDEVFINVGGEKKKVPGKVAYSALSSFFKKQPEEIQKNGPAGADAGSSPRRRNNEPKATPLPQSEYALKDKIEVVAGPWKGLKGRVTDIKPNGKIVVDNQADKWPPVPVDPKFIRKQQPLYSPSNPPNVTVGDVVRIVSGKWAHRTGLVIERDQSAVKVRLDRPIGYPATSVVTVFPWDVDPTGERREIPVEPAFNVDDKVDIVSGPYRGRRGTFVRKTKQYDTNGRLVVVNLGTAGQIRVPVTDVKKSAPASQKELGGFKIGDQVEITGGGMRGSIGEIVEITPRACEVKIPGREFPIGKYPANLKKVTPGAAPAITPAVGIAVGDRVEITGGWNRGETGTVVYLISFRGQTSGARVKMDSSGAEPIKSIKNIKKLPKVTSQPPTPKPVPAITPPRSTRTPFTPTAPTTQPYGAGVSTQDVNRARQLARQRANPLLRPKDQ